MPTGTGLARENCMAEKKRKKWGGGRGGKQGCGGGGADDAYTNMRRRRRWRLNWEETMMTMQRGGIREREKETGPERK